MGTISLVFLIVSFFIWLSLECDERGQPTARFGKIVAAKRPSILEIRDDVDNFMSCASACIKQEKSLCRGYQVFEKRCHLFTGIIEENADQQVTPLSKDILYKAISFDHPKCSRHPDYQTVMAPTKTFCFYPVPRKSGKPYREAREHCKSRGGSLMFVDNKEKLNAAYTLYDRQNPQLLLGMFYDPKKKAYYGENEGQVLYKNSSMWRSGEPSGSGNCVLTTPAEFNDIPCDGRSVNVCEMMDIF